MGVTPQGNARTCQWVKGRYACRRPALHGEKFCYDHRKEFCSRLPSVDLSTMPSAVERGLVGRPVGRDRVSERLKEGHRIMGTEDWE